tara:strand:- start:242 stop:1072 length:831 start_codon:yes stop_codon:yes gene_type:complete
MTKDNLIDIILIQKKIGNNIQDNINSLIGSILKVKVNKTTIITLHELSYLRYIAITKESKNKNLAIPLKSKTIKNFCNIAKIKGIYLVFPFYEINNDKYYNTTIIISPEGKIILRYRKRNIPNEICYEEKYYFSSSMNRFPVTKINGFNIGLMTCWDQWYSTSYNELFKKNVDLIICPTAIGTAFNGNKKTSLLNEKQKWINIIVANSLMINTPIVVPNRIGKETKKEKMINFWGSSFITNANGDILYMADNKQCMHKITMDLNDKQKYRKIWGFH